MRVVADLQVHTPYSRATSKNMDLKALARFASMKGLNVVGTGDFTHPDWRKEIRRDLQDSSDSGLYRLRDGDFQVQYMITGEVNTTFQFGEKSRRIHHCLLAPSIEAADAVSDRLAKYGNLLSDGRPTLRATAPELVDEVLEADRQCVVFLHMPGPLGSASSAQTVGLTASLIAIRTDLIEFLRLKQACPQILR